MEKETVLLDTSLCAIVRDEKMNPAGGIARFIDSHVPYVEEAVIVDTGSIDGTREVLEEFQSKYPNLRVYDTKFKGYANARNFSLTQVKTKRALVLDADELLTHKTPQNDFEVLKHCIKAGQADGYNFNFISIIPEIIQYYNKGGHNLRLFDVSEKLKYCEEGIGEVLRGQIWMFCLWTEVKIKHFLPSSKALRLKKENWYDWYYSNSIISKPPSKVKGFAQWKEYNPRRDDFE